MQRIRQEPNMSGEQTMEEKSMTADSVERLELLIKVAIEKLADRERLIEALSECILTLQRDTMN